MYEEPEFLPWDGRRVPITFVGGYLGAGKTTAINEVLAQADRPIAVIVNDVGAVNIDAALIRKRHGDTIELTNGCVCCNGVNEMGAAFDLLRARTEPPDHVIVELSGVSEPARMTPWGQSAGFMLDGIVVVVAADQLLDGALPRWVWGHLAEQITAADLLILTKTDLVDPGAAAMARARLAEIAPLTPIFPGGRDAVVGGTVGRFLGLGRRRVPGPDFVPDSALFDAHEVDLVPVPPMGDRAELTTWLRQLAATRAGRLVRAKGVVSTPTDGLLLVQVVGNRIEVSSVPEPERQPSTDLVVITLAR